jgi:hypothetical protein
MHGQTQTLSPGVYLEKNIMLTQLSTLKLSNWRVVCTLRGVQQPHKITEFLRLKRIDVRSNHQGRCTGSHKLTS